MARLVGYLPGPLDLVGSWLEKHPARSFGWLAYHLRKRWPEGVEPRLPQVVRRLLSPWRFINDLPDRARTLLGILSCFCVNHVPLDPLRWSRIVSLLLSNAPETVIAPKSVRPIWRTRTLPEPQPELMDEAVATLVASGAAHVSGSSVKLYSLAFEYCSFYVVGIRRGWWFSWMHQLLYELRRGVRSEHLSKKTVTWLALGFLTYEGRERASEIGLPDVSGRNLGDLASITLDGAHLAEELGLLDEALELGRNARDRLQTQNATEDRTLAAVAYVRHLRNAHGLKDEE